MPLSSPPTFAPATFGIPIPGVAGLVLTTNALGSEPSFQAGGGGGHGGFIATRVLDTTGTYVPTAGCGSFLYWLIGGGGGSGGLLGSGIGTTATSGGGAGAVAYGVVTSVNPAGYALTIGAAGMAGASGDNNGGNGGDSVLGLPVPVTAPGGKGSTGSRALVSSSVPGGMSDLPSAAALVRISGAGGGAPVADLPAGPNAGSPWVSGFGGSNPWCSGGAPRIFDDPGAGIAGSGPGAGASGALTSDATNYAGGPGTRGALIVIEFSA